jgi:hypothetical protein
MCHGVCSLFRLVLFFLGNYALDLSVLEETFNFINLRVCKLLMFLIYRAVYTLRQVEASEIAIKGNLEKMQQRVTYQIRS